MNELKILLINLDNELVIYVEQLINYANRIHCVLYLTYRSGVEYNCVLSTNQPTGCERKSDTQILPVD